MIMTGEGPRCDGVRVLLTGGTSGLGRAMARSLVAGGASVAITGRNQDRADLAAAALVDDATRSGTAVGIGMDVRDSGAIAAGVRLATERLGGIDALILNAGIGMRAVNPRFMTDPQPFWQVTQDGFHDLVATNLTGYFLVARQVVPAGLPKLTVTGSEAVWAPRHAVRSPASEGSPAPIPCGVPAVTPLLDTPTPATLSPEGTPSQ